MTSKPDSHIDADPLVDEVRRLRANLSQRHGNDLSALFSHLRKIQAESGEMRRG